MRTGDCETKSERERERESARKAKRRVKETSTQHAANLPKRTLAAQPAQSLLFLPSSDSLASAVCFGRIRHAIAPPLHARSSRLFGKEGSQPQDNPRLGAVKGCPALRIVLRHTAIYLTSLPKRSFSPGGIDECCCSASQHFCSCFASLGIPESQLPSFESGISGRLSAGRKTLGRLLERPAPLRTSRTYGTDFRPVARHVVDPDLLF